MALAPVLLAAAGRGHRPADLVLWPETCRMNIEVAGLTPLNKRFVRSENLRVLLRKFGQHFLAVLYLHQGWSEALDRV